MQFENAADYIFENPELSFHEHKAQKILCDLLSDHGFTVKKPACSLPTSFEATYVQGNGGKKIAFMDEYDALPEIGHACGHHLIGTSSSGAAMILHPTRATMPDDISFASLNMEYHFFGKAAHAAAYPWKGANALSSVIQMFNAVDSMRVHLRDYTRVHGIITNGGTVHNIISETASALFKAVQLLAMSGLDVLTGAKLE